MQAEPNQPVVAEEPADQAEVDEASAATPEAPVEVATQSPEPQIEPNIVVIRKGGDSSTSEAEDVKAETAEKPEPVQDPAPEAIDASGPSEPETHVTSPQTEDAPASLEVSSDNSPMSGIPFDDSLPIMQPCPAAPSTAVTDPAPQDANPAPAAAQPTPAPAPGSALHATPLSAFADAVAQTMPDPPPSEAPIPAAQVQAPVAEPPAAQVINSIEAAPVQPAPAPQAPTVQVTEQPAEPQAPAAPQQAQPEAQPEKERIVVIRRSSSEEAQIPFADQADSITSPPAN